MAAGYEALRQDSVAPSTLAMWLEAHSTMFDAIDNHHAPKHNEPSIAIMADAAVASRKSSNDDGATTPCKRSAKSKQDREKGFKPSQYKTRLCRRCVPRPCLSLRLQTTRFHALKCSRQPYARPPARDIRLPRRQASTGAPLPN